MLLTFEDFREKNQIKRDGKIQQLRFLTKRSYLNDRFQAQAYLKVDFFYFVYVFYLYKNQIDSC